MKPFAHLAVILFLTQCTAEVVRQVPPHHILYRDKLEGEGQFIGFADGRAFKCAKPAALFPWVPKKAIWWCYESELTAADRQRLVQSKKTH